MIRFRPATKEDARYVAQNLRTADLREVEVQCGPTPVTTHLVRSWEEVDRMYVADSPDTGRTMCLIGVKPVPAPHPSPGAAVVFLLGTPEIENYPVGIYRETVEWRDRWLNRWSPLFNRVDLRNEMHVRWIQAAGFRMGDIESVNGHDFQYFSIRREDV